MRTAIANNVNGAITSTPHVSADGGRGPRRGPLAASRRWPRRRVGSGGGPDATLAPKDEQTDDGHPCRQDQDHPVPDRHDDHQQAAEEVARQGKPPGERATPQADRPERDQEYGGGPR